MWMLTTRRPTDEFVPVNRLNRLVDTMFRDWPFGAAPGTIASVWEPAVDALEDQDAIKLVAELPGVKPEDVKISLEHNTLTLRGEKKQTAESTAERVHRYERSYGAFHDRDPSVPFVSRRSPAPSAPMR